MRMIDACHVIFLYHDFLCHPMTKKSDGKLKANMFIINGLSKLFKLYLYNDFSKINYRNI